MRTSYAMTLGPRLAAQSNLKSSIMAQASRMTKEDTTATGVAYAFSSRSVALDDGRAFERRSGEVASAQVVVCQVERELVVAARALDLGREPYGPAQPWEKR